MCVVEAGYDGFFVRQGADSRVRNVIRVIFMLAAVNGERELAFLLAYD